VEPTEDTYLIWSDIFNEVRRQRSIYGLQELPDGTNQPGDKLMEAFAKRICHEHEQGGRLTWRDVLNEEVAESVAADNHQHLDEELVQVAAVAVSWIAAIRRRGK
jgi:hypothetical protein